MLLWEALLVGAVFGGLLLFISLRGPSSAQAKKRSGPTPPPALRPPGTPGTSERRKSVTFVRHCTPPSQRRQRQEAQEALVQRNIDLWERTDLAERLRLAEQEEGARREAEARHRSSAAEETRRIIDAILRSPICAASAERERWEESGQARRRRSSVPDSVARSVVPKRAWRTRSDEVHQHHQPHQPHQPHQQQCHHRQQPSGEVEGDKEGDDGEETDLLAHIQKALKREQEEVNRIEEELRKIEEENLQMETELGQESDNESESECDVDGAAVDADDEHKTREETEEEEEEYESGEEHERDGGRRREDNGDDGDEWNHEEMEEEVRSMEDEIQMIEEEQRFIEEENRKIEQELREEADQERQRRRPQDERTS